MQNVRINPVAFVCNWDLLLIGTRYLIAVCFSVNFPRNYNIQFFLHLPEMKKTSFGSCVSVAG